MDKLIPLPTMKEFIWDEFMKPLNISVKELSTAISIPESQIKDVFTGRAKVDADFSIRLGRYFSVSDDFFLNIQNDIDERAAKRKNSKIFNEIKPVRTNSDDISFA